MTVVKLRFLAVIMQGMYGRHAARNRLFLTVTVVLNYTSTKNTRTSTKINRMSKFLP